MTTLDIKLTTSLTSISSCGEPLLSRPVSKSESTERAIAVADLLNDALEGEATEVALKALVSVLSAYVHSVAEQADRAMMIEQIAGQISATCSKLDKECSNHH